MFGRVGESGQNRGHAYMFASFVSEKSAVLVAFMAGNAAQVMETKSDNEVIDSVLKVLKQMYGDDKVAEPISRMYRGGVRTNMHVGHILMLQLDVMVMIMMH